MDSIEPEQECPQCGRAVMMKLEDQTLQMYDFNGQAHVCKEMKKIGGSVTGHIVEGFQLRDRRLLITLDGGITLEINSIGFRPLKLRLVTPEGVLEE